MSNQNEVQNHETIKNSKPKLKIIDISLRMLVIPLSIASLSLTITNNQDNVDYGNIHFFNFNGLKYMVCVSGIAVVYAVVAAISNWISFLVHKPWVYFISDQAMAYVMVTSGAVGGELLYLASKGDKEVAWSEACTSYGMFCTKLKFALFLHFLSLFCFLLLALISSFRAFSIFDPPLPKHFEDHHITY